MKAVPAQVTGLFREWPAPRGLDASFACIWVHRMPETDAPPIIITPDGTIDLQWFDGTLRIAGPDSDPQTEFVASGATVVGFRFRPAAAASWLGVPAKDILGRRIDLEDVWGAKGRRLAGRIRRDLDIAGLVGALENVLAQCTPMHTRTDSAMRAAFGLVSEGLPIGASVVPYLERALAMSERTLRRRFDESFGYGPKTLDRILRYQRFRRLARASPRVSTALLAAEAGYADQAHLVRERRRLTGSTPSELNKPPNVTGNATGQMPGSWPLSRP